MATATLAAGLLHQLLPATFRLSPHWIYPTFLIIFLVVLIAGDPGLIDRQRPWLRVMTGLMIGLITVVNALAAIRLIVEILSKTTVGTPGQLLATGAIIWLNNVIAFGLWFWDVDGGGAAARLAAGPKRDVAFVFPEMTMPELVPAGWSPAFVDYLTLSFNTATAFGPTDVSAIKRWAKLLMILESLVSLALVTLVLARAINVL